MQWGSVSRHGSWCFLIQYNTQQKIAKGYCLSRCLCLGRLLPACYLWQQERRLPLQGNPSEASLEGGLGTVTPHHLCSVLPIISHLGLQGSHEIFPLDISEWSQLLIKCPGGLQPWKFYLPGHGNGQAELIEEYFLTPYIATSHIQRSRRNKCIPFGVWCMWVCVWHSRTSVSVHTVYAHWGQRRTPEVLLYHSLSYFLETWEPGASLVADMSQNSPCPLIS